MTCSALAVAGCATFGWPGRTSEPSDRLTREERVTQALSRLTFGRRPGDAERVAAIGVDRWVDEQLYPETIRDTAVAAALAPLPSWNTPTAGIDTMAVVARRLASIPMAALAKDPAARAQLRMMGRQLAASTVDDDFFAGKGWPDRGDAWMNFGEIYKRMTFGVDLADGRMPTAPIDRWSGWTALSSLSIDRQIAGVVNDVLGGTADPVTRPSDAGHSRRDAGDDYGGRAGTVTPTSVARAGFA